MEKGRDETWKNMYDMNERGGSGGSVAIQRSIDDDAAGWYMGMRLCVSICVCEYAR